MNENNRRKEYNKQSKFNISKELLDDNGNLKSFKEQLKDTNFSRTFPYVVSQDSMGLTDNNLPITINPSVVNKIIIQHKISKEELYYLPQKLRNYILITKSQNRKDSIIIFINQFDIQGRPIMISMQLNKYIGAYEINNITSIYGRNNAQNFIKKLIIDGKVLKHNKKIKQWLTSIGVQFSKDIDNALFNSSITSTNRNVNTNR